MLSEQAWLLTIVTWIALIVCGIVFAVMEKKRKK